MRIAVAVELTRPSRRSLSAIVAVLLLAVPTVALASHNFTDVPNSHPFHDQIAAITGAGIATGFNDGTYRPSEAVTRQAMAAFLQRGVGHAALTVNDAVLTTELTVTAGSPNSSVVPVQNLTITVPGVGVVTQQWVYVRGRVTFESGMHYAVDGCPCEMYAQIRDTATNRVSGLQYQTFESASTMNVGYLRSVDVEGLFPALTGPRTFVLEAGLGRREDAASATTFPIHPASTLSAMTFPFGEVENPNEPT